MDTTVFPISACNGMPCRAIALWLLLLGLVVLPGHAAADDPIVYLRQVVRADYTNGVPQEQLGNAVSRPATVQSNDTLSSIISRHYGVGVSNAPAAYSALESTIVAKNGLKNPGALRAHSNLQIPVIPHIALTSPSESNRLNLFPKIAIHCQVDDGGAAATTPLCREISTLDGASLAAQQPTGAQAPTYVFDALRKGAQFAIQVVPVRLSEALKRTASPGSDYAVDSAPLEAHFADGSNPPGGSTPTANPDYAVITQALSGTPRRHPVLIVFDDSWPDDQSFRDSRDFFVTAIRNIRAQKKMGPPRFSAELLSATAAPLVSGTAAGQETHAAKIKRALGSMVALDTTSSRVQVIYLPIVRAQKYAADILENLVAVNLLGINLGVYLDSPPDFVPADTQATTFAQAHTYVSRLATVTGTTVQTDQSVVQAVLFFTRIYGSFPDRPIFVNMSWTVPNLQLPVDVPPDAYGLSVVAAGNECPNALCNLTVFDLKRQFAYRSLTPPGDMLAVMDLADDGAATCGSSLLKPTNDVVGVGFSGFLSTTECGTSFSAPRVAWLLAAREAMLAAPPSLDEWKSALHTELTTTLHDSTAAGFNRIRLRVDKLFAPIPSH